LSTRRLLSVIHGPLFGGAHNQLVRLQPGLAARGFEAIAALPLEAGEAASRIEGAGVEVVRLPLGRLRATANPLEHARLVAGLRRDLRELRRTISERSIDLVQVHGVVNPQAGLAGHLSDDAAVVWQLLDTRAPIALRRMVMPAVVRWSDSMTSWGVELARSHAGATSLGERLVVVFPPVELERFVPSEQGRSAARERLGIPEGDLLVGTVGVRNPQKGHQDLVQAASLVRRSHPGARFRVLGAPSPPHAAHMGEVEATAESLGLRLGEDLDFVDPAGDVAALLQGFDVFVMTSVPRSEGMPTAILEAMACAKPVVSTDVGAVRELVSDGETALVVEPERPEQIAAAITRLLDDARLRERMGASGRARAETCFDLDKLADKHALAYELALEHRARRESRRARRRGDRA
jgi:glycosyltransferase involved in cell wall biosynthesis